MPLPRRIARVIMLLMVVAHGVSVSHVTAAAEPACAGHCPAKCPMYAKRMGCHCGAAVSRAAPRVPREPGLYCTSCAPGADRAVASEQPALLPALPQTDRGPSHADVGVAAPRLRCEAHVDPPLRPPT